MALLTVVQARTASTRMPDKVLLELDGNTILEHVIHRLALCEQNLGTLIVATGSHRRDNRIEDVCKQLGVPCFRGPEHDVLNRFFLASINYAATMVLRVTADCPLLDPTLVDQLITGQTGDITRIAAAPKGIGEEELITHAALFRLWNQATEAYDREHVTTFAHGNPDYTITYLEASDWLFDRHAHRLVLDTPDDWKHMKWLYEVTEKKLFEMPTRELIETIEALPVTLL